LAPHAGSHEMKKRARDATATGKAAENDGLRRRGLLYSLDNGRLMGVPYCLAIVLLSEREAKLERDSVTAFFFVAYPTRPGA
jgi:hypothetical protein